MIKNKQESDYQIRKRGLNRMLEDIFKKDEDERLKNFLDSHPYPYYNIRDKGTAMGQFLYKITANGVLERSKDYEMFSVYESLAGADEKLILQGDIQIERDFTLMASLSNIKGISNRIAMQNPVYSIVVDLVEENEPYIEGLSKVIDYIVINDLFDMIVEFSLFEIPVGINNEKLIIWELRNY